MEVFWIIILVLVLYIPMITLISFVRSLFSLRKGKTYAKERFRDTFLLLASGDFHHSESD